MLLILEYGPDNERRKKVGSIFQGGVFISHKVF